MTDNSNHSKRKNPSCDLRVMVIEDNDVVRSGLVRLLDESPGFRCTGDFPSVEAGLPELRAHPPDVLLMDIGLPGMSGIEGIRLLRRDGIEAQVMVLTIFEDDDRILESIKAGANSYLLKGASSEELLRAIRDLHGGGAPMSLHIARRVLELMRPDYSVDEALESLTVRERQVLELLADGYLYKEIAGRLGVSVYTVRSHVHNIYEKLHVNNRTEAIRKFHGHGTRRNRGAR